MSTPPKLELYLFGVPEIHLNGAPVEEIPPKRQSLLFYLALTRERHFRATLATFFWGDTSEKNARASLRKAIKQLLSVFPEHFTAEQQSVELCKEDTLGAIWVDTVAFEQKVAQFDESGDIQLLEEAVALYKGDFLAGFYVRNTPDFEKWQTAQQARLREIMLGALQTLSQHQIVKNDLARAVETTRRIIDLESWREEAHLQLMELLAQNGQRAAALNQYEICRQALWDEMDVGPSEDTKALYEQIKLQESKGPQQKPAHFITTTDYILVGRTAEWKTMRDQWRRLKQPHFVCIAGEAGIGKTRLAEELLMLAEREGQRAVRTRSHALEGRLAYGPVGDWLRAEPLKSALANLDPIWRTEVARILPELLIEDPDLPHPEPIKDNWQRKRLFEALAHAFTQSQNKLLLVLDDLQWCDNDTLEWLQYLLESADNPLLVVGTVRPEEIDGDHPLHRIRQQFQRLDRLTTIDLTYLTPDATLLLAQEVADHALDAQQSDRVFDDTAGNPLFVIESIRLGENSVADAKEPHSLSNMDEQVRTIPPKMHSVIQSRLTRLSPEATQVMQMGATIGRSFDVELLAHATEMTTESILNALDELWQQRVIREVDTIHFDFSHDRIRDVAYGEIGVVRRRLLHGSVADSIKFLQAEELGDVSAELFSHYRNAGQVDLAVTYCIHAANMRINLWALGDALELVLDGISIMSQLPETEERVRKLLSMQRLRHDLTLKCQGWGYPQHADVVQEIERLAAKTDELEEIFFAQDYRRLYYSLRAQWENAADIAIQNFNLATSLNEPQKIGHASMALARIYFYMGKLQDSHKMYTRSMGISEKRQFMSSIDKQPNASLLANIAHCVCLLGYPEQARQLMNEGYERARTHKIHHTLENIIHFDLILEHFLLDSSRLCTQIGLMREIAEKYDFPFYIKMSAVFDGWAMVQAGQYDMGIKLLKDGIDYFENVEQLEMWHVHRLGMLIAAYLSAELYEQGIHVYRDSMEYANKSGDQFWVPELHRLYAELLVGCAASDDDIEESYQNSLALSRQQGSKLLELRATTSLCRLWQKQGKSAEAHQLLAPIYGWFTEGFDTVDLKEAKALLEELT